MGRQKQNTVPFNTRIDAKLKEKVDALLEDPLKPGKVKYGGMIAYINKLVAEDLRKREAIGSELLEEMQNEFTNCVGE